MLIATAGDGLILGLMLLGILMFISAFLSYAWFADVHNYLQARLCAALFVCAGIACVMGVLMQADNQQTHHKTSRAEQLRRLGCPRLAADYNRFVDSEDAPEHSEDVFSSYRAACIARQEP